MCGGGNAVVVCEWDAGGSGMEKTVWAVGWPLVCEEVVNWVYVCRCMRDRRCEFLVSV